MINKSELIDLAFDRETNILKSFLEKVEELNIGRKYVFCQISYSNLFGPSISDTNRPFPQYFYIKKNLNGIKIYESPNIISHKNEIDIYVTDRSIQSLVYVIQNMFYVIDGNIHTIYYKIYDCDYCSYKISFRDVSKIRNDKISSIISG